MGTKQTAKTSVKATNTKAKPPKRPTTSVETLHTHHKLRTWLLSLSGGIMFLIIAVYVSFQISPWPESLLIRTAFDKGGQKTAAALEKYVPSGVVSELNQQYKPHDKDGYLDVFYPETIQDSDTVLPTVVWIHGGAWVSGDKKNVANYLKILASRGYTVVGVDYTIAPEKKYPTPVLQVNQALQYLTKNAKRLHIDSSKLVLAGDSAGSQIAAQVGTIITNPAYAKEVGIDSPLQPAQLKGMILNCGAYDLSLPNYNGEDGKFLKTVLWAYSGSKDFLSDPVIQKASVVDYVNANFPPSFITAGNVDPLEPQSREFAQKLTSLGVPVDALFYAENHEPKLQHEYQFNLDGADGRTALNRILDFLRTRTL